MPSNLQRILPWFSIVTCLLFLSRALLAEVPLGYSGPRKRLADVAARHSRVFSDYVIDLLR